MLRRHLLWARPGWLVQQPLMFLTNTTLKAARYRACAPRPSARAKVASRLFLDRAATPPRLRRGVLYVLFLAVAAASVFAAQRQQQPDNSPIPPILQKYQPVTAERLKNPEDGNWLMIRRTYNGWGYSPLEQITPANASRLHPVWVFSTAEARTHEAAPIVNNGVMFVSTPNNQVIAIDAKTGNVLWRYRRQRPPTASVPHETNRGVALYADKVYYASGDAILVALEAKTGEEVWATTVADNKSGYYIT